MKTQRVASKYSILFFLSIFCILQNDGESLQQVFQRIVFDVYTNVLVIVPVAYAVFVKGFLPYGTAGLFGDRAFELFNHPRNRRGELCSPVCISVDDKNQVNMVRHDTVFVNADRWIY